jgi:aldehyde:ferredoxin oxidoreductase
MPGEYTGKYCVVNLTDRAAGRPPLGEGPLRNVTLDMETLQDTFFQAVGWDPATGGPTREKMAELGIDTPE